MDKHYNRNRNTSHVSDAQILVQRKVLDSPNGKLVYFIFIYSFSANKAMGQLSKRLGKDVAEIEKVHSEIENLDTLTKGKKKFNLLSKIKFS
jgi:hypothetical protein